MGKCAENFVVVVVDEHSMYPVTSHTFWPLIIFALAYPDEYPLRYIIWYTRNAGQWRLHFQENGNMCVLITQIPVDSRNYPKTTQNIDTTTEKKMPSNKRNNRAVYTQSS